MALSTDTYWDVNGVPLQTLAYNISTWGGDLQAPPPLRGEDLTIPYVPGRRLMPRVPDSRSMTFNMWVVGADVDGKVPASATMRAEFEKNFKMLRNLFWNQGKPITLTKRWREYGSSTVLSASATGIFSGGFAPSMNGAQRATYSVEVFLPDPFFYGAEQTVNFAGTATSNQTFTVPGDYETSRMTMTFNGARTNMRLTNTSRGIYVNVNHVLGSGSSIVVNPETWTAVRDTTTNVVSQLTYVGHTNWMSLAPGSQTLSLTSSSGTGTGVLKYTPRYL